MCKRTRFLIVGILLGVFFGSVTAVFACPHIAQGPHIAGGTSDPVTVVGGNSLAYTIYAFDKDKYAGGSEFFDYSLWVYDQEINSIDATPSVTLQGDDTPNGKRTWTVSGTSKSFSGPVICYDRYQYSDYPMCENGFDLNFYDGLTEWYTKTVTVNHAANCMCGMC